MTQNIHPNTPFIKKLHQIINNPEFSDIICWDPTEIMIDILDEKRIQTEVLPKFFRHSKYQSFIRQLNLYGFKKMKKTEVQRFRHPDLTQGSSLFSIKSQRKLKILRESNEQNLSQDQNNLYQAKQKQNIGQNQTSEVQLFGRNNSYIENKVRNQNSLNCQNWPGNQFKNMLYYPQMMNFQNQMNPFYFNTCVNNNFGQMGVQLPLMATNQNNLYFYN